MQILVASFQAAAERVLRAETHGGSRGRGARVGLGQAAGSCWAQKPNTDTLSPWPLFGGPAARGTTCAPGRSSRAQHQGSFEEGHGLGAAGDYGHEKRGSSAKFFLHRPKRRWKTPTEGAGRGELSCHSKGLQTGRLQAGVRPPAPPPLRPLPSEVHGAQ